MVYSGVDAYSHYSHLYVMHSNSLKLIHGNTILLFGALISMNRAAIEPTIKGALLITPMKNVCLRAIGLCPGWCTGPCVIVWSTLKRLLNNFKVLKQPDCAYCFVTSCLLFVLLLPGHRKVCKVRIKPSH